MMIKRTAASLVSITIMCSLTINANSSEYFAELFEYYINNKDDGEADAISA